MIPSRLSPAKAAAWRIPTIYLAELCKKLLSLAKVWGLGFGVRGSGFGVRGSPGASSMRACVSQQPVGMTGFRIIGLKVRRNNLDQPYILKPDPANQSPCDSDDGPSPYYSSPEV